MPRNKFRHDGTPMPRMVNPLPPPPPKVDKDDLKLTVPETEVEKAIFTTVMQDGFEMSSAKMIQSCVTNSSIRCLMVNAPSVFGDIQIAGGIIFKLYTNLETDTIVCEVLFLAIRKFAQRRNIASGTLERVKEIVINEFPTLSDRILCVSERDNGTHDFWMNQKGGFKEDDTEWLTKTMTNFPDFWASYIKF